ncbi:WD40 repeat-like protein [Schizopora paradoxa]|uniref:WD40 repeat-like protein n=1 Tax=Schizopora paradoxa TaxID=27342 RepID=A0A0H2S1N3_9AGAM|nr:WD40 repeat-like protein [Schizopora paradoxa]
MNILRRTLSKSPNLYKYSLRYERMALRGAYAETLDRVNVLGNDEGYGHTGCVNALSWARDGEILLSGGDDTTVRLWRIDPTDTETPYPYKCDAVINTGHQGNIFNAYLLPSSSHLATVSGDGQVRVFDIEQALAVSSVARVREFKTSQTCIRKYRCHRRRTKRIVTEESSDVFLTVAEDGAVRQHDLREPHRCRAECPAPLAKLPFDLSSLSLSPLVPYYFTVAGESPYGFLFDRRQSGRILQEEWGVPCTTDDYVTCVRRLGRKERARGEKKGFEHVTGTRMSQFNGHEVTYSSDAVYLYSMHDEAHEYIETKPAPLPPNSRKRKASSNLDDVAEMVTNLEDASSSSSSAAVDQEHENVPTSDELGDLLRHLAARSRDAVEEEDDTSDDEGPSDVQLPKKFQSPIVLPQRRFAGACNVETIKDVNFVGSEDEYVASGSDDGNFFLWEKSTGHVHGIYEGDGSVVNVIESHPRLPVLAVSGIDTTVKLFAPSRGENKFSRFGDAAKVIEANARRGRNRQYFSFASMIQHYQAAVRANAGEDGADEQCTFQ